ncbi:Crp/Fnr family transcriptional regulator [Novosphingobium malaysiense]|uniref:HTH crp-type domain-containing protein n=1 Tax=Novosphingobium malaysiense TaxID=1348853 RepID=A0A0B1ZQS5_9SPHN|nr:Crp/Fnr family transcriptional regulator [Novosphingobium malaysiense]KHK91557.1 hypothetical protein LK12_12120 [Novosphingobium malaysiense]
MSEALKGTRRYSSDQPIWSEAARANDIYIVDQGCAYNFLILSSGRRYIGDVFGPGAICNWRRSDSSDAQLNINFKAGTQISALDFNIFHEVLSESHLLNNALRRMEVARELRRSQRTRNLIAQPATVRVINLLLDLEDEWSHSLQHDGWVPLPLTQEEMGDLLGLTQVHVNRVVRQLERDRCIRRRRGYFCILDRNRFADQIDYQWYSDGRRRR